MNEELVKLISRTREAVDRGDMLVGHSSEFKGDLDLMMRMVDIPIGKFGERILLKLRRPRLAKTRRGEVVRIVSYYDGLYYAMRGTEYREKDLCWIEEKELP